jgi:hypothetical protein
MARELNKLPSSAVEALVFRRKGLRRSLRKDGHAGVEKMIGSLADGDEISGVTNGQFHLIDILQYVIKQTGPADIVIATWTMGMYDAEESYRFVTDKLVRSIRWIVDPFFFARHPELSSVLVKAFGVEAFRAVNSHAKFFTARSDRLAVTCRSSMNLNRNDRLESYDISADSALTAFFEKLTDDIFAKCDARNVRRNSFQDLLSESSVKNPKRANPFGFAAEAG